MPPGIYKHKLHSEETKRKISEARKGKSSGMLNKHLTEEHKRKIGLAHKGSKSHSWKGGITDIRDKIRMSIKYKQWRQDVFIRDSFTCQKCGERGGNLHVHHHKKSFSNLLEEVKQNLPLLDLYEGAMVYTPMWDINNGITLCKKCHKKTKNYLLGGIQENE